MTAIDQSPFPPVRPDFVPACDYISPEFLEAEATLLWPRVWQPACRLEELSNVGDRVVYDILGDSVIVVRTGQDEVKAYHNVCPHRGRRLCETGHGRRFHCRFHGWQWSLDGKPVVVVDREDWGDYLPDDEIGLAPVRAECWGGWVFINFADDAPPLLDFLEPARSILDPFEIDQMRYKWRKELDLPCNWKVALEAFTEGYHVQTTHRQLLRYIQDLTFSAAHGLHSMFGTPVVGRLLGVPSKRLGDRVPEDVRRGVLGYYEEMRDTLDATVTEHHLAAARRLFDEVAADASPQEVLGVFGRLFREEAEKAGVPLPSITPEQAQRAGSDWHIFPNLVFLQGPITLLGYRARPLPGDPDRCRFEVFALERFAPGKAPKTEVMVNHDAADEEAWGLILTQDFQNMAAVQAGMHSRGFAGARPNPVQEVTVSNFHKALRDFMFGRPA